MSNKINWLTRVPYFPDQILLSLACVLQDKSTVHLLPINKVMTSTKQISTYLTQLDDHWEESGNTTPILDQCILAKANLTSSVLHQKAYWTQETHVEFPWQDKLTRALAAIKQPQNNYILVVTQAKQKEKEVLSWAYTFNQEELQSDLPTFMLHSNQPVDQTAKISALYQIEHLFSFNWKKPPTNSLSHKLQN